MGKYRTLKAFAQAAGYTTASISSLWHLSKADDASDNLVSGISRALGMSPDEVRTVYLGEPVSAPRFKDTASRKAALSPDEIERVRRLLPFLEKTYAKELAAALDDDRELIGGQDEPDPGTLSSGKRGRWRDREAEAIAPPPAKPLTPGD